MSRTSRKKEKPFDHISLLLMQRRRCATPAFAFKEVCPTLEGSSHSTWVLSPLRGPLAGCICGLMRRFLGALWSRPPLPLLVLHDRRLSCCLLWLTELSNYISNEAAKCEKTRQLYSLQTFPPPRPDWRKFLETLSAKQTPSKSAIKGTKSTAQGVIDFLAALKAFPLWWATSLDTSSPTAARLHRCSMSSVAHLPPAPPTPALINSFVLPSARVFPQTNCWQKHLC